MLADEYDARHDPCGVVGTRETGNQSTTYFTFSRSVPKHFQRIGSNGPSLSHTILTMRNRLVSTRLVFWVKKLSPHLATARNTQISALSTLFPKISRLAAEFDAVAQNSQERPPLHTSRSYRLLFLDR